MPTKAKTNTKGGREKASRKLSATRRVTAQGKHGDKAHSPGVASKKNPLGSAGPRAAGFCAAPADRRSNRIPRAPSLR